MSSKTVYVRMLGDFAITYGGNSIDDNSNRSRKVWMLLAYLIYNRSRLVPQEELINLLWAENDETDSDPRGALKAIFYRVRTTLDKLEKSAGKEMILSKNGAYTWNSEYEAECDFDIFEKLCKSAREADTPEEKLDLYNQAFEQYGGGFLSKLSMESWVIPIDVYFSDLYINAIRDSLNIMEKQGLYDSVVRTAKRALSHDPYNEEVFTHLMSAWIMLDERKTAVDAYEEFRNQIYTMFGVQPSDRIRELYREAAKTVNTTEISADLIKDQLRESKASKGALICEYDFFKVLYHSAARAIVRNGDVIHIAMFSMTGKDGSELSKRSLECAMENLQEQIRINLRSGDSAARCSISQFVVMLQQSNYENSCMVCDRLLKAFFRQYPHSPAEIHYSVQPLEPLP